MFKKFFTSIVVAFAALTANADDFRLLELDRFSMEVSEIGDLRDPYYPYASPRSDEREKWRGGMATKFNLALFAYRESGLFLDNRLHGEGTNKQFRTIGWEYNMRLQLGERLNLFHYHHSRHIMDDDSLLPFPLENRFGAEYVFFKR